MTLGRRLCTWVCAGSLGFAFAACSSSAKRSILPPVPTTSSTVVRPGGRVLQFRVVEGVVPYVDASGPTTTLSGSNAPSSCENGKLVTLPARDLPNVDVILADNRKTACYALGRVVWSAGADIADATADVNEATAREIAKKLS
jgi:hypothetical protein